MDNEDNKQSETNEPVAIEIETGENKVEDENESPLNTERSKKRKKKKKLLPGHNLDKRPEWFPTRYHYEDETTKKPRIPKKVKKKTKDKQTVAETEGNKNEENSSELGTNTETSARSRRVRYGDINWEQSAGHTENNSLLESMDIDLTGEPPKDRQTDTGTVKTARSSIPTLPDVKPHGQGVYIVRPFPVNQVRNMNDVRIGF